MFNEIISLPDKIIGRWRHWYDRYLLRRSGLFDTTWYLTNNKDVAEAGVDPLHHYLYYGGFEGRSPGPDFSSQWYLERYKDVKQAGINPLIHFIRYGRKEGRKPKPEYPVQRAVPSLLPGPRSSKIFCIGMNKTGTTSLERVFHDLGYKIGVQSEAELLLDYWAIRDFHPIIQYCESAQAFQDIPFSLDFTFQILDHAFPGSKFILTIRDNAEVWYRSLVNFHARLMGLDHVPTADQIKEFPYRYPGYLWHFHQSVFGATEATLYDEELYKGCYTNHNNQVMEYFKLRPESLLVLNLSDPSAMEKLCQFLGIEFAGQKMPHLNKLDGH